MQFRPPIFPDPAHNCPSSRPLYSRFPPPLPPIPHPLSPYPRPPVHPLNIGEHHNIRKQIFSFLEQDYLYLGGGGGGAGGGAREQVPPFPGGLYIVNYWKSANNLCIQGLLKFSRLGFEVADEFFISISFEF